MALEKELAENYEGVKSRKPRILYWDSENAPILAWVWDAYETNVLEIEEDPKIISVAWMWEGEKTVHAMSLPDTAGYAPDRFKINDREIVEKVWDLLNECDVAIAQNGNRFDVRMLNARFLYYGMPPPKPYQTVDTLIVARRYFKMPMHKLDEMLRYLRMPRKIQTGGKDLWFKCMNGDKDAWRKMVTYNKNDVKVLVDLYKRMRGWYKNHPNLTFITRKNGQCPVCLSFNLRSKGPREFASGWKMRFSCQDCGKYITTELNREDVRLTATLI